MATKRWVGLAVDTVQITELEIISATLGGTFAVTIGGRVVPTVASSNDPVITASEIIVNLHAETHPYFTTIEWVQTGAKIIATAKTAGIPFIFTAAGGGFGTSQADLQVATGKHYWSNTYNWSSAGVPAAGDDLIFSDNDISVLYGIDPALTYGSVLTDASYTGEIGHDYLSFAISADGRQRASGAAEYRTIYCNLRVTDGNRFDINKPTGNPNQRGSRRLMINVVATKPNIYVYDAQQGRDAGRPTIRLLGSAAFNLYVSDAVGGVGIGDEVPAETSSVGTLVFNPKNSNSWLVTGDGTTITAYEGRGDGTATIKRTQSMTTAKNWKSTTRFMGAYAVADFYSYGGRSYFENLDATAEITACRYFGGVIDLTTRMTACKIGNLYIEDSDAPGQILANDGMLTINTKVHWLGKTKLINRS